jgi:large subunit ribosomal protein L6
MSRVGKLPVAIPEKVEVQIAADALKVKGPKGELSTLITGDVTVSLNDGQIWVKPANDSQRARAMWGTVRSNVANVVQGVSEGFNKTLELHGVGYRCALATVQGMNVLTLSLGFSHEVKFVVPKGVECKVDKQTVIMLSGADKQLVGEVAATLRKLRKPEPYKGKGVRYSDEKVRRKEGKKK